jgi:ribonuclease P protein component
MADNRFPKRMRLLVASDFDRVFAARASASDSGLVLYGIENELGHPRLGLAVSRKYGSAVARNRWKRAIREAFRGIQRELPALDLICLPRGKVAPEDARVRISLNELSQQIANRLRRRRRDATHRQQSPSDRS